MKKLSDYKGTEAIELWADLLEPAAVLLADKQVQELRKQNVTVAGIAAYLLKEYSSEVQQILLRIDPQPLTALNMIVRLVDVMLECMNDPDMASFFALQAQMTTEEFSGSAMVNTVDAEN